MTGSDLSQVAGRERIAFDEVTASPLERFGATLDREPRRFMPGDAVPPLGHWLFFLPGERQSALGEDGHAARPAFENRLGRAQAGRFRALLFVTVRHEIAEETGEGAGPVPLTDEHDIVCRGAAPYAGRSTGKPAPQGDWQRMLVPDERLLFRYSALTFNGHRIHYDKDYATGVEGCPGLVVHGPLMATLLMDLLAANRPGARLASYSFRARHPLFCGEILYLNGLAKDSGKKVELWAADAAGRTLMTAKAALADTLS